MSGSPTVMSTKLVSVLTSSDLPMKIWIVAARLIAPIWMTRSAFASPKHSAQPAATISPAAISGNIDRRRLLSTATRWPDALQLFIFNLPNLPRNLVKRGLPPHGGRLLVIDFDRHVVFLADRRARHRHRGGVGTLALLCDRRRCRLKIAERDAARVFRVRFASLAQHQRQRADGSRQRQLLGADHIDLERHRLGDRWL